MPKKAILLLAEGFEEVEALTPVDYLRRAGVEVCTAAIGSGKNVPGAHGIPVTADAVLGELLRREKTPASSWDAVLLPGGMPGAANLAASAETGSFLKDAAAAGKWVCAICASPTAVLFPLGLLQGRAFTCFPGMETQVSGALWQEKPVVVDGNIITSRAAGTAAAWALTIIAKLVGEEAAEKIASSVLLRAV
ncbi:MAG: DJ-1/PfpI family protein [Treponema sp.]|jgi:4-methyl-5(b-hydroxyethyl)-thiazole monophosphate biosynthesis|nr:DJ-1/PfpI family protein [Treponema sp.]